MATLPDNIHSAYLSKSQLKALNRLGDLMVPGNGEYPRFSELGCIAHVDLVLEHAQKDDLASLKMLLSLLSIKPTFAYRVMLWCMKRANSWPEPLATLFRLLDTALRGIVVSLYYSGLKSDAYSDKTPLELMGYELNIVRN